MTDKTAPKLVSALLPKKGASAVPVGRIGCGVVAFLRHFCSDLGAMDGIFEPAKSEKSGEGGRKIYPPP